VLAGKQLRQKATSLGITVNVLQQRLDKLSSEDARKMAKALSNTTLRNPNAQIAFAKGISNPYLDENMAVEVIKALPEILHAHPEAAGLFTPLRTRGPGARAWIDSLATSSPDLAAGAAYELLATRKLMHKAAGNLKIHPTDKITFGPKLQARYDPSGFKTQELLSSLVQISPDRWSRLQANPQALARRTVESDLAISRSSREIFVDFKHTQTGARNLDTAELLGVAVALATGEIHEAHFVCNAAIDGISRQRIDDINRVLSRWGTSNFIQAHQHFGW
jgi:hypothetical protein